MGVAERPAGDIVGTDLAAAGMAAGAELGLHMGGAGHGAAGQTGGSVDEPGGAVAVGEVHGQTREARQFLLSDPSIPRFVTRVAVVTRSPVSRVMATIFTRLVRPQVPFRVFGSEEQALPWLREGLSIDG